MHPLVPIIRFYLACIVALIVAAYSPAWGMLLLGTGFGWWKGCGCCSTCCPDCDSGSPSHSQYQIVITGVANGGGCLSCTNLNATFTVSCDSALGTCVWDYTFPSPFCTEYTYISLTVFSMASAFVQSGGVFPGSPSTWQYNFPAGTTPCGYSSQNFPQAGIGTCNISASTCTVTGL